MTMPRPVDAGNFAERIYSILEPYAADDPLNSWALLVLCGAQGQMSQEIETYASEGPLGEAGWSMIVDLNRAPNKALPWLGQFVGAVVNPALTDADQRQQIRDVNSWKRGSPGAIQAAPVPYLTGVRQVILRERDPVANPTNPAYGLTVITYTSQTPDSSKVLAALMAQKPTGIKLNYLVLAGQDYQNIKNSGLTYAGLKARYLTYNGLRQDSPGA